MWVLLCLELLMCVFFRPGGGGLGGEDIVGVLYGSRAEFGQGFPYLEVIFPIGNVAGWLIWVLMIEAGWGRFF